MQAETRFKQRVIEFLKSLPDVWFVKIQQVVTRGTPDILACINGYFVALELKRSSDANITALQGHNLSEITKAGGISLVSCPESWFKDRETLKMLLTHSLEEAQ